MNNPTRFTKQEDLAAMADDRHRFESLPSSAQMQERLHQLQTFIRHLANTDQGRKDLQQRVSLLGPCQAATDETPAVFYGRLRRWLDQDLVRHARRARREAVCALESQRLA